MDKDMKNYLLDTNIIIYYWKEEIPGKENDKIEHILKTSFNISIITKIELLGWKKHTAQGFMKAKDFLGSASVIPLDNSLAEATIDIRRIYNIKLAGAVIAATALLNDLVLVTRNERDFESLDNLEIYNPFMKI